ncbi:MAG: IS5 family transposase [Candidatus Micrarchaeales archaeon]
MQTTELLKQRKERGYEIAKSKKIVQHNGVWIVPSATNPHKTYEVVLRLDKSTCTCPDFIDRGIKCKHIFSVELTISKHINKDGSTTITETKRIIYPQNWKAYNTATTQQKELFMKLLNELCNTIPSESEVRGRGRPKLPLKDMAFASALKVFTTFSLRRFTMDMKEAQGLGYIQNVPHYSSVALSMENPELTPIIKELITLSSLPLKTIENNSFSIDSSGISPSKFSRWYDHKYGKERDRKIWYKVHLLIGNKTHIACGVEITSQYETDTAMLPQLVNEAHKNFQMNELAGDKAYLSRTNLDYLDKLGITPFIPFKANSVKKPMGSQMWKRMYNYFALNQEAFLEHYHQRSNIESAFFMIKSKFGDYVRSKTETASINEILLKVLCHNICVVIQEMFELGITPNFLQGD